MKWPWSKPEPPAYSAEERVMMEIAFPYTMLLSTRKADKLFAAVYPGWKQWEEEKIKIDKAMHEDDLYKLDKK